MPSAPLQPDTSKRNSEPAKAKIVPSPSDFWVPGNTNQTIQSFISHSLLRSRDFLNLVNHCHFDDRNVLIHLVGNSHDIIVPAHPLPSSDKQILCECPFEVLSSLRDKFIVAHILVDERKSVAIMPTDHVPLSGSSVTIPITHRPYRVTRRKGHRHPADNIEAAVLVGGKVLKGRLIEFSIEACHLEIALEEDFSAHYNIAQKTILIALASKGEISLKMPARIMRLWRRGQKFGIVARPMEHTVSRFRKRKVRNPRLSLDPPPLIRLVHPLSGREMELEAYEISSSGFSVLESDADGVLIPGLFIKDLKIHVSGSAPISCSAQVIHRSLEREEALRRVGVSIVDMGIQDYNRLSRIITSRLDPCVRVSAEFSTEALWDLFFSSSFIYPDKYAYIHPSKDRFKETHNKICSLDPDIAKSFLYQKGNVIYAHLGLVRAFEKSWMLHHHAAKPTENRLSGLIVLKNAMFFLNDMHRYPSSNMRYAICFFRPNNRFPRRAFGGFSDHLNNDHGCALYRFSYHHWNQNIRTPSLPKGWAMEPMKAHHLDFILNNCGNSEFPLLINSMGTFSCFDETMDLEASYARYGMIRRVIRQALSYNGETLAILVINRSDPGLNLSGLLDCIYFIVTPNALHRIGPEVASKVLGFACSKYPYRSVPVISYPAEVIPSSKSYMYWALDVIYGDEFMAYMKERFKI